MSCLTTSATRRSRSVPPAVLIASAAASSHEVLLVPMISVTLYTLITLSFDHVRPSPGLLRPACHKATPPCRQCRHVIAESAGPGGAALEASCAPSARLHPAGTAGEPPRAEGSGSSAGRDLRRGWRVSG